MVRCILTFGYLILYITIFLPFLGLEYLLGNLWGIERRHRRVWQYIRVMFAGCTFFSGAKLEYRGTEKIPKDCAVVYTPNHKGYFDIILSYRGFAGPTGYVAKKELDLAQLGLWMRGINCIFLDREDPKSAIEMIRTATENLKNGISVCIFPEGTRIRNRDIINEFPGGSFKMALRAGAPIVPVAITGTYDMWEAHFPKVIPQRVIIEFGDPIYPANLSKEDQKHIGAMVRDRVLAMYRQNM